VELPAKKRHLCPFELWGRTLVGYAWWAGSQGLNTPESGISVIYRVKFRLDISNRYIRME